MPCVRADDVFELTSVSDPRIGPDGRIAYVVTTIDREQNEYLSSIWVREGDESRPLTDPTKKSSTPRWSPDGHKLAFASKRDTDKMQLYVMPMEGGEPTRLTSLDTDVEALSWSGDGTRIVFACRELDPAYKEDEDKNREPRRISRLFYKLDNEGWIVDRPMHLYTVSVEGGEEPEALTKGEFQDSAPSWSPDGSRIAFAAMRHDDWDVEPAQDIYLVDREGGEPRCLTRSDGWCEYPSWSPDGKKIAFIYSQGIYDEPRHGRVAVLDVATGDIEVLTGSLDRNCGIYPPIREVVWDGDHIYFPVEDRGNTHLYRVPADGSDRPEVVIGGDLWITGYDARDGRTVHTATSNTASPELFEKDRRLTDFAAEFTQSKGLIEPERFTAISADGYEVEAWIMKPAGFEPGTRHPVLLSIHGGPFTQYGNKLFDEFQVFASAGYVVLYSNPRGSSGYGEEEARAIRGPVEGGPGWGTRDYEDLMAVVDTALERYDFCDPERLGVLGGSYGGFMTTWIVGHTDRFKAACSERAVNNWYSMQGSSDLGYMFKGYFGAFAHEEPDAWMKHSPISYATNITTPMLILHSETDLRCPIEQAEQLFAVLRLRRRDVEFVRFPGEGHELSRSGSPRHRVRRFEIILDWFDRKLKV